MHAHHGIVTWATWLVANLVDEEPKTMISKSTGLHMRAAAKVGGKDDSYRVSWNKVSNFAMRDLEDLAAEQAPVKTFIANAFTLGGFGGWRCRNSHVLLLSSPVVL